MSRRRWSLAHDGTWPFQMMNFSNTDPHRKIVCQTARGSVAIAVAFGTVFFCAGVAQATPVLTEGSVLPNYAIVSVGPSASIMINSGPINGNVLVGDGSTVSTSGGNSGGVTGHVDESGTVTGNFTGLQTPPVVNTVAASVGTTAFSDAQTLSTNAAALTPTQAPSTTITGNGGLNVIDFTSLTNPVLTINGTASDFFVFNVSGELQTNQVMTLNGVSASQILWNFTGTMGTVFQTSGGDQVFGTFLATDGGGFQFSNLDLTGQLIDTGGHIQDVSGSKVPTFVSVSPPAPISEPSSLAVFGLVGLGFMGLGFLRRRRAAL